MPDLAVIMSVYHADRLKFVRESVESILDQSFRDYEYYIVFDGPVNNDVDDYITSLKDSRIRLHRLDTNTGLACALNYLLALVLQQPEIKYIARMDADDVSLPERFSKQREFLISNTDISIVGSWYEEIDEDGKVLSLRKLPADHESLRKRYYTRTPFAHPSVMYRRELLEMAGYYPEDTILMEDNVLWGRALVKGLKLANIPGYLLKFRIDKDFYKRRSGLEYGWRYIRIKTQINRRLECPKYIYPIIFFIGILKMLPAGILKCIYHFK